jgi:uncharacterized protein
MPIESETELAEIVRSAKTVAVIGIKDGSDPYAPAYAVPKSLQARGFRILPVNPTLETVLGERALPSVAELPERPDIIEIFRRPSAIAEHTGEILALPAHRRPDVVWMQTGIRDDSAAERLSKAGIRVVMDRCLGVYASRYRPRA